MPVRTLLSFVAVAALAGCSASNSTATETATAGPDGATASSSASASSTTNGDGSSAASSATSSSARGVSITRREKKDGGEWEFVYAWPAAVAARPKLAAMFQVEADKMLKSEKAEWLDTIKDSPDDCASCKSRSFGKEWKAVASIPGYLSLSADVSNYTGGAHGMYGRESEVWVESSNKLVDGADLFVSPAALDKALQPALCKALNAERAKRRGPDYPKAAPGDDYGFDSCQHVKDATVFVGSTNGKTFDRVGIYFGPYVAGPYAEGAYELNLPVTPAVLATVRPQYKAAFSAK